MGVFLNCHICNKEFREWEFDELPRHIGCHTLEEVNKAEEIKNLKQENEDLKLWLKAFSERRPAIRSLISPVMSGESWYLRDWSKSGAQKDLTPVFEDENGLPKMTDEIREILEKNAGK